MGPADLDHLANPPQSGVRPSLRQLLALSQALGISLDLPAGDVRLYGLHDVIVITRDGHPWQSWSREDYAERLNQYRPVHILPELK